MTYGPPYHELVATKYPGSLGFGIRAKPERPSLDRLGRRVQELGYDELWSNNPGKASGLGTLAACARGADRLDLAVGVIALSDRDAGSMVDEVRTLGLPLDRLLIGVGAGSSSSVELVRKGVTTLRELLPDVGICVAAMGPRMLRLAGEVADVVLLNWLVPERIGWSRQRIAEGAELAARAVPRVAAYVRVAIGADSAERLGREAERYRQSTPAYAAAFAAQEIDDTAIGIAVTDAGEVPQRLEPYRASLDTCVVRGLPASDDVDAWLEIAEAAAL